MKTWGTPRRQPAIAPGQSLSSTRPGQPSPGWPSPGRPSPGGYRPRGCCHGAIDCELVLHAVGVATYVLPRLRCHTHSVSNQIAEPPNGTDCQSTVDHEVLDRHDPPPWLVMVVNACWPGRGRGRAGRGGG